MARACCQLVVYHGAELAAQRLGAGRHCELVTTTLHEIDQSPAHDAVRRRDRATLDGRRQHCPLMRIKARATPRDLAIDQVIRSMTVEPQHPVPHRLQANATGARSFAPAATVINHRQRQKPTNLPAIATSLQKKG